MAFVILDNNGNITTMFNAAQTSPPAGYAVIADNDSRIATFLAGIAAAENPPPTISFLQFIALFTPTEQAALVNSTDTNVKLLVLSAAGAVNIQLTNAQLVAGVNYVQSIGILTPTRAAQVLAGQLPS